MRRSLMAQVPEGAIPRLTKFVQMPLREVQDFMALVPSKAFHKSELQRIEPELGGAVVFPHVDVGGSNRSAM